MKWLLLFALLIQPAPPVLLSATFTSSTSAIVAWEQPAGVPITCLRIYHAGYEWPAGICWRDLEAGPMRVELPGIYAQPAYRPQISDRLVLAFGMQDVGTATLGETVVYRVYLPLVGRQESSPPRLLYLPAIRFSIALTADE